MDVGGSNYLLERSYTYDKAGHQLTDTTGDGTITSTFDDDFNLTGVTDRQGATYSFTYDNNQNQLSGTENSTGKAVSFSYSSRVFYPRLTMQIAAAGTTVTTQWVVWPKSRIRWQARTSPLTMPTRPETSKRRLQR